MAANDRAAHRWRTGAVVAMAFAFALSSAMHTQADGPIEAGDDPFKTHGFSLNFFYVPLPPDFFDPGSEPFAGNVQFVGEPVSPSGFGDTDTIIRRPDDADPIDGANPGQEIPIELVQLNLVSVQPIQVNYPGSSEMWNVRVGLSQTEQSEGTMRVARDSTDVNFFTLEIDLLPRLEFTRQGDSAVRIFDYGAQGTPPIVVDGGADWTESCPIILQVPNGTANFCPGGAPGTRVDQWFISRNEASPPISHLFWRLRRTIDPAVPNLSPVMQPIADQEVAEGGNLFFSVQASDPDGDPLTLTFADPPAIDGALGLPPGCQVGQSGGGFGGFCSLPSGVAGTFPFLATVTDGRGGTDSESAKIVVTGPSQATLVITKFTDPAGSSEVFQFASAFGGFALKDGESERLVLAAGSYSFFETVPDVDDWELSDIFCIGAGTWSGSLEDFRLDVALEVRQELSCEFVNENVDAPSTRINMTPKTSVPHAQILHRFEQVFGAGNQSRDVFPPDAVVYFNGTAVSTVVVSDDVVEGLVPAILLADVGAYRAAVVAAGNVDEPIAWASFYVTPTPAADVDGNGCVDAADLQATLAGLAGLLPPAVGQCPGDGDSVSLLGARSVTGPGGQYDANFDGQFSVADSLYIRRVIAGLSPE